MDTKLNAMEGMFKHWCGEEDIDKKTLKDSFGDDYSDEEPYDYYSLYKVRMNKTIELDLDYDDGIKLPDTFEELKKYLDTENKKKILDKLID